jgi:hypothetical protein
MGDNHIIYLGHGYGVLQYFSYIGAVSFIGGGNRRKPPTRESFVLNEQDYIYIIYLFIDHCKHDIFQY